MLSPAYSVVVIGTSQGGLDALRVIISALPADYPIPLVVVQHRHRDSDATLARFLQGLTSLRVCEIDDKQPLEGQRVFIAPPNYHMLVERGHFSLSIDAPVRYSRPSIDLALTSASEAYAHHAVGVVLTGANGDGAAGLRNIADRGGLAVVQDPRTAEAAAMPKAALDAVPTARVLPLGRMASFLVELASVPAAGGSAA